MARREDAALARQKFGPKIQTFLACRVLGRVLKTLLDAISSREVRLSLLIVGDAELRAMAVKARHGRTAQLDLALPTRQDSDTAFGQSSASY